MHNGWRTRTAILVVAMLLASTGLAAHAAATGSTTGSAGTAATASSAKPGAAPRRPMSVKDSPGYRPLVDPESMSVVIGRRLNAPLVSQPFTGGALSLGELGRAVVRMLNHDQADSLLGLCITESEFKNILWQEFPQSRPVTHLEWLDGWKALFVRHRGGVSGAIRDRGLEHYEFVRMESRDTVASYKNFRLHNAMVLVVRSDGREQELRWIRSVAERKGRFKIYSTDD